MVCPSLNEENVCVGANNDPASAAALASAADAREVNFDGSLSRAY